MTVTRGRLEQIWCGVVFLTWTSPASAQSEIIDGWTDLLISLSNLVIIGASLLGLAYTSVSLVRAYKAPVEDVRAQHLFAALFGGCFTIIGVFIGWISALLIPGAS